MRCHRMQDAARPEPPHRANWSSARLPAWGLLAALNVIVLVRVLSAERTGPTRSLSEAEQSAVGRAAAALEPTWRRETRRAFPGDNWSQDDDFQNRERAWVFGEARLRDVTPREIFRAIDVDLHAHPPSPPRKATASPCKPRPFYD